MENVKLIKRENGDMMLSKVEENIFDLLKINSLPNELEQYIAGSNISNKSFSEKNKVLFIEDKGIYLKISEKESLRGEYENTFFFNNLGVAGEIVDYLNDDNYDYLLIKELNGESGISDYHVNNPKKLVAKFAEHLRMIHELKYESSPQINRTEQMMKQCNINVREDKIDMEDFFNKYGFTPNQGLLMLDSLKPSCINDVYIHGEYCLPNIIMKDYEFSGIINMNLSGIGDRHFDIISAIKSLGTSLKTREYDELFFDAYGRELIDKDRLAFAKLLLILSNNVVLS